MTISVHSPDSSTRRRCLARWWAIAALAVVTAATSALPATAYDTWRQVEEAPESRGYTEKISEGKFGDEERQFIVEIVVPQLGLEANRTTIFATRRRMRDLVVRNAKDARMIDAANKVLVDALAAITRDDDAEPLTRVNAILLAGELLDLGRKPWAAAAPVLVAAVGDGKLPLAVRVAALAGLVRHLEAAGPTPPGPLAEAAGPVIAEIVTKPPAGDPVAVDWLVGRALTMLPKLKPPPAAAAAAARLLADETRPIDTRVRAAAAVGRIAGEIPGLDAAAAVDQVRALAIAALDADLADAAVRKKARQLTGTQPGGDPLARPPEAFAPPAEGVASPFGGLAGERPFGGDPAAGASPVVAFDPDAVPPLACRRDAWRLAQLAEAIKPQAAGGGSGLAGRLEGQAATTATALATTLADEARNIDLAPEETTVAAAVEKLRATKGMKGDAAAPPGPGGKPAPGPAPPRGPGEADSPFGQPPAEESPFGKPAG